MEQDYRQLNVLYDRFLQLTLGLDPNEISYERNFEESYKGRAITRRNKKVNRQDFPELYEKGIRYIPEGTVIDLIDSKSFSRNYLLREISGSGLTPFWYSGELLGSYPATKNKEVYRVQAVIKN